MPRGTAAAPLALAAGDTCVAGKGTGRGKKGKKEVKTK